MNSINLHRIAVAALGLFFSILLAGTAQAGPGPQYWQSAPKATTLASNTSASATAICPNSMVAPITVMQPAWTNGRGPLVARQVGTERLCNACPVTSVAITNQWPNHRGPLTATVVTNENANHVCSVACPTAPNA